MQYCAICRQLGPRKDDQLCLTCRETITRLLIICNREPTLCCPPNGQAVAIAEAEEGAIGAYPLSS